MVESVLIFVLGFMLAAFIALTAGPVIWRRASELTRRRIEASLPLSLQELQADKDQYRAEHAIALRKAEVKARSLQDKMIAHMAEAGTARETARVAVSAREAAEARAAGLEAELSVTMRDLADRNGDVAELKDAIQRHEDHIAALTGELEVREAAIVELQLAADSGRIELAARATETEQIAGQMRDVTIERKSLEEKLRSLSAELRAFRDSDRRAKRELVDAQKRSEKTLAQLADRDARLQRRESELSDLKAAQRKLAADGIALEQKLLSSERKRASAEGQVARLTERLEKMASMAVPGSAEKSMRKLQDDKTRLLALVAQLTAEKDDLVRKLKAAKADPASDARLRDEMYDVTAKIVALADEAEGGGSPVRTILNTANKDDDVPDAESGNGGLAGRIRSVQRAARRTS